MCFTFQPLWAFSNYKKNVISTYNWLRTKINLIYYCCLQPTAAQFRKLTNLSHSVNKIPLLNLNDSLWLLKMSAHRLICTLLWLFCFVFFLIYFMALAIKSAKNHLRPWQSLKKKSICVWYLLGASFKPQVPLSQRKKIKKESIVLVVITCFVLIIWFIWSPIHVTSKVHFR